jgi:hypothetical protein
VVVSAGRLQPASGEDVVRVRAMPVTAGPQPEPLMLRPDEPVRRVRIPDRHPVTVPDHIDDPVPHAEIQLGGEEPVHRQIPQRVIIDQPRHHRIHHAGLRQQLPRRLDIIGRRGPDGQHGRHVHTRNRSNNSAAVTSGRSNAASVIRSTAYVANETGPNTPANSTRATAHGHNSPQPAHDHDGRTAT